MKKIKVLMLVPNLFVANGVASFVMNYLRNLNHDEVQVDIASYKEGDSVYYAEVEAAGGKMFFLPGIKNLPEHVKVCNKILSDGRYDIIHDNTLHISIPMMWCAKRQVFRYGFCTAIIQKWERHLLKRSEIVFFFQCCVRWRQIMRHVHSWQAVQCSKIKGLR